MSRLPFVTLALAVFAVPVSGASAATCSATATNPNTDQANLEVAMGCDTAINNGSISLAMNRGGQLSGKPEFDQGGSMTCSVQPGPGGTATIACSGSLPAGSHAIVDAQLGPGPCDSPAFSASLSAAFGDGTTYGPQPIPPMAGCPSGGGGGGGGGGPSDPGPGHSFDPGGVFQGNASGLPSHATVAQARHGLSFSLKLGVKGKVVVTIEVGKKVVGRSPSHRTHAGPTHLVAKLSAAGARALAGRHTRAKVHVEVIPDPSEGFATHGRHYYGLTLTG